MGDNNLLSRNGGGIGNVIKGLRVAQNLSTTQLAERMGVTSAYISKVESNKGNLSEESIDKFSKALGVSSYTLLYFKEQGKKSNYNHQLLLLEILKELTKEGTPEAM